MSIYLENINTEETEEANCILISNLIDGILSNNIFFLLLCIFKVFKSDHFILYNLKSNF